MTSTSPPFPLLRLPYLPLYKVLSNFECEELHYNNTLQFYPPPKDRKHIITALIDHFSETFKIPITFVEFIANDFDDYLSFVPCISESEEIEFYGKTPISEEDQVYIKRTVKPKAKLSFYPRKDE
ncbi:hypothetical protein CRE_24994 [Caenorhabditis remanei]|uniref:DUF38 domain-containing protein n=1 Tax=Caenorhabditis remanei TaxID=31234 RepID=E3MHT0_CAERE|nr:hypothetical protein CRE_24994 [Caenorhabditis remanei]